MRHDIEAAITRWLTALAQSQEHVSELAPATTSGASSGTQKISTDKILPVESGFVKGGVVTNP